MCYKLVFLFLFVTELARIAALEVTSQGVCTVKISSQKKRMKYYTTTINKWCGRRKCVVRKTKMESYAVVKNELVCCAGWEYNNTADICSPRCGYGCIGGRCVAPDKCHCDPPAYLNKNTCVLPVCDPPCFNADCVANNTCHCFQNFTAKNATHCANCAPGFDIDDNLNCIPRCDKECVNGECTGLNICSCLHDYKPGADSYVCDPICEPSCVNGQCIKPNMCACDEGYVPTNNTHCEPNCGACAYGECVSPNNCVCLEGYTKMEGICKPVCKDACVNGYCSSPDECSCYEGYQTANSSACFKPCNDCNGMCNAGVCNEGMCEYSKSGNLIPIMEAFAQQVGHYTG